VKLQHPPCQGCQQVLMWQVQKALPLLLLLLVCR
jgi:hypothetical protein